MRFTKDSGFLKSIRTQLILILSAFILISILTSLYTAYSYDRKEEIHFCSELVSKIERNLLKALKEQENYFNFEISNNGYFESKQSAYLDNYHFEFEQIEHRIEELKQSNTISRNSFEELKKLEIQLAEIQSLFDKTIDFILLRGFRNYGIEGDMRDAIHKLERIPELSLVNILMLRRHEKDFILRQDPMYISKHNILSSEMIDDIKTNHLLSDNRKESILKILEKYCKLFDQVAYYEREIGLKSNTGLKKKLNEKTESSLITIKNLKSYSDSNQEYLIQELNYSIGLFWLVYISLSFFLSIGIARKFTRRIQILSNRINYFVNTNFTTRLELEPRSRMDEVGKLWNNFIKMEREIVEHIELFKEKVDEKTLELSYINQEIELKNKELEEQKEETERKNKDLLDGIKYGWRIQGALIPDKEKLIKNLGDSFMFFLPKDIVSGDIYWTHKIKRKNSGEENLFSVIDCTGHGVPGAFMSILAINALNQGINKKYKKPVDLIRSTNSYVYNSMKYYINEHSGIQLKDGMEMLICKLNRTKKKLEYAGALRPLYIVRENVEETDLNIGLKEEEYILREQGEYLFFEVMPTKKTVGTVNGKESNAFEQKKIDLKEGDMLYLTSDGYSDQFGGPYNKKFLTKHLRKLLIQIHFLNNQEQRMILKESFLEWKGENEQVDDISIMGVRV